MLRAACFAVAITLVACGSSPSRSVPDPTGLGQEESSRPGVAADPDASAVDDGGSDDAEQPTPPVTLEAGTACGASVPGEGTPCTPSAYCEYGANAEGACSTFATCAADTGTGPFTWHVTPPPAGCGTHGPQCSASFSGVAVGTACTVTDSVCDYAEGRCSCIPCSAIGSFATGGGVWRCEAWSTGGAGCPSPRPLLGSPCTQEGVSCNYSFTCSEVPDMGPRMACQSGEWSFVPAPPVMCPPLASCADGSDAGGE